jgi:hypothetical protein
MPAPARPASHRALEEARYRPMGLVLRVRSDHPAVLGAAEDAFRGFGPADPGAAFDLDLLVLARGGGADHGRRRGGDGPGQGAGNREPASYAERGERVVVTDAGSTLIVDRGRGRARGRLTPALLADPVRLRVDLLELALQLMLPARGFLGVHGAAVVRGRRAALLRATGGGGKTTLAYAAASRGGALGLRVLAEDVVWIDLARGSWWGLPWWAHPRPEAGRLFPELAGRAPALRRGGGPKLAVALESMRPGSASPRALPGPVVVVHRRPGVGRGPGPGPGKGAAPGPEPRSGPGAAPVPRPGGMAAAGRLVPLALPEALELWSAGRAGTEEDFPDYDRHVEELLRGNAWRLDVGDGLEGVLAALGAIAELLAAVDAADGPVAERGLADRPEPPAARGEPPAAVPRVAVIACRAEPRREAGTPGMAQQLRILQAGEFYHKERFGPETVNRGAVLLECEWDGGVFESGVMLGGLFRDGEFQGGTFWGGIFWAGRWRGGTWESGFDREGRYRPRTDAPESGASG